MRFPHLCDMIFDHLDNQSLVKCKIVSKTWIIYIEEQKFYGIRNKIKILNKLLRITSLPVHVDLSVENWNLQ